MPMRFAFCTNVVSPHQMPLAKELATLLGEDRYRYIHTEPFLHNRAQMGWTDVKDGECSFCISKLDSDSANAEWISDADILCCEERLIDAFERRLREGKRVYYVSERWFKPVQLFRLFGRFDCMIPGWVRLAVPRYWKMAKRFAQLFNYPQYKYFHQGPWAKKDMLLICRLFGVRGTERQMVDWGYFVAPSRQSGNRVIKQSTHIRILWVGRMIDWKRVDTIVRAVREIEKGRAKDRGISLTLVGDGVEKPKLMRMAKGLPVTFLPSQPIENVRGIMREHDVYVLSSNGKEGWGAALNEALEEGLATFGTFEAGASAALLPKDRLFHSGDWKALSHLLVDSRLTGCTSGIPSGYTAKGAAERMLAFANE